MSEEQKILDSSEQAVIRGIQEGCRIFLDWECQYPKCECEVFPQSFRAGLKAMEASC